MKIINPSFKIIDKINGDEIIKKIEKIGRTAYKSEDKITDNSAKDFIRNLIKNGHLSVIEHVSISVQVICDRGISHEIVRHRIASYTQESTRYCNYTDGKFGGEITFIKPAFFKEDLKKYNLWKDVLKKSEETYSQLINLGANPQEARSVLPNSLKTEIIMTMNLREWRHFFELRTSSSAHPQMQEIARPLLDEFKEQIPVVFDDINY